MASTSASTSKSGNGGAVTKALREKRKSDAAHLPDLAAKRAKRTVVGTKGVHASSSSAGAAKRKVYCDGSSRGNGKKGAVAGIGVFWSHEEGAPYVPLCLVLCKRHS